MLLPRTYQEILFVVPKPASIFLKENKDALKDEPDFTLPYLTIYFGLMFLPLLDVVFVGDSGFIGGLANLLYT